jgi:inward rectifier potassium channel
MAKLFSTSGFGEKFHSDPKPIINQDGSFNVTKIGARPRSLYQHLVSYSWPRFLLLALAFYLAVNAIFALVYFLLGAENLDGIPEGDAWSDFLYCFFLSVQTFTTVGYGHIYPIDLVTNIVATIEAVTGLMGFALITGLLYGRFSRPNTKIRFSQNMLITSTKTHRELHFQVVNERKDVLLHPQAQVIVKINEKTAEGIQRRFYELELRISRIVFFPLNWRIVHVINKDSPLHNLSQTDYNERELEFLILLNAYDNVFRQNVYKWHEYMANDVVFDARFITPYETDETGETFMNIANIDKFEKPG